MEAVSRFAAGRHTHGRVLSDFGDFMQAAVFRTNDHCTAGGRPGSTLAALDAGRRTVGGGRQGQLRLIRAGRRLLAIRAETVAQLPGV
ncbi:MAG: hypothetical protein DCC65_03500 [Planctomycetota bacterium]|nr:MAG: hypothetical protein DCC65_03500 [Planctomycetota bacterium]